jgi:hypothetical protein
VIPLKTHHLTAVDSLQNAVTDTVLSMGISCGFKVTLTTARLAVVLVNVPIMLIALQGYNIAYIFLGINMTTTCTTFPIALGLVESLNPILTGNSVLFGSVGAIISVIIYGWIRQGSIVLGIVTYFCQTYDAGAFLIGSCSSIFWTFIWIYGARRWSRWSQVDQKEEEETETMDPILVHECPEALKDYNLTGV